jgi:hypothetical protein
METDYTRTKWKVRLGNTLHRTAFLADGERLHKDKLGNLHKKKY